MKQDQGYYIAEDENDFIGLEILYIEYWKEGVKRVWARKCGQAHSVFYMIFASDELTKNLIEVGK